MAFEFLALAPAAENHSWLSKSVDCQAVVFSPLTSSIHQALLGPGFFPDLRAGMDCRKAHPTSTSGRISQRSSGQIGFAIASNGFVQPSLRLYASSARLQQCARARPDRSPSQRTNIQAECAIDFDLFSSRPIHRRVVQVCRQRNCDAGRDSDGRDVEHMVHDAGATELGGNEVSRNFGE